MPEDLKGLSSQEAQQKLEETGQNLLPEAKSVSDLKILLSQFQNPLVYILFLAAAATFFLGRITDASVICLAVFINTILGAYQERKAEKAIAGLKKLVTSKARVRRDGQVQVVNAANLVEGDIVFLTRGEKVPADGLVFSNKSFFVDESILTGESQPVERKPEEEVYMGTVVASGQAVMQVTKTGAGTQIGKIAQGLERKEEATPLEKKLHAFSRQLAIFVGIAAVLIFLIGLIAGRPIVEIFATAVALAVSAVPEGLIVSLTVILAVGMQRILRKKALVRKLLAAETLGSVTVICVDKTGTITEGRLKVVAERFIDKEEGMKAIVLANDLEDPLEVVRWEYVREQDGSDPQKLFDENPRLDSLPFSPETKYLATLHQDKVFLAGAPELLLSKSNLTLVQKKKWQKEFDGLAQKGLRLVGFASRQRKRGEKTLKREGILRDLKFIGFLAFSDPVREDVGVSLALAQEAGIKIKVITGDYRLTAEAVLKEIGLTITSPSKQIIEGEELERLSDKELGDRIEDIILFVRTKPFDKLRIVEILKAKGEVVAMTGDGVNDALALQKADIGIVVEGASEVAKETADMILLDANFNTIVAAVEEGRGIFDNLRKVILYLLSDAFGEILLVLGTLIAGLPLALTAGQILWINLVSDGFPDLALTVDPKRKNLMTDGPVRARENLINFEVKALVVLVSLFAGLSGLLIFAYFLGQTNDLPYARSLAFAVLGTNSLFYVFSCRSLKQPVWESDIFSNRWLILGVGTGLTLLLSAFYFRPFTFLLEVVPLGVFDWGVVVSAGLAVIILIEATKFIFVLKSNR
ncbi:MAG: HAD-IC family P-type ATPase [bacterium]|nr:HAD-IC family P-type ATPase [bacterium]